MKPFAETSRTILRELLPQDAAGMFEMDSDPEVHKYVGKRPVQTIQQSRDVIEMVRKQYVDNGIGRWAVIEKSSGVFIGWSGFKLMKETINGHTNFYDFGYRFKRTHWGKGFATESGKAGLAAGIELLRLTEVFAMTDVDNVASRNVLEKLGFRYMGDFKYDADPIWRESGQPTTWFELKP